MGRKKDRIWEYVEESNGRFTCKFCKRNFAGGAPRIKSHLAGVKGRDIDLCTKVPKDVQAEAYLAIGGPSKKLKSASNLSNAEEIKTPTSRSNDLPQTTMLEMCKKKDQSAVDELLTQHLLLNEIPFDVIQTTPFIHFVEGVAAYGSGYKVPSYLTLRTKLIPKVEAAQTKKRNRLESKMEKSNTSEGQDLEPNDLDKLNELPEYVDPEQDKEDDTLGGVVENVSSTEVHTSESRSLQLKFVNSLSLPVFTGARIEGEDCSNIQVALIDALTEQTVISGPESSAKVEIVVLEGDFDGDENDNWTGEEFKNNIVREREGKKPLLTGDAFVNLKEGAGVVGEISFTDNSSWTRSRRFRLAARVVDKIDGTSIREAKTESFIVTDHREELYKKDRPSSLLDEVWRLENIDKDEAFHKRLRCENINTVKDFLTLLFIDPPRLQNILGTGMSAKMWEVTVEHARTCVLDDKRISLYCSRISQQKTGVVFNVVGQVMRLITECQCVPIDKMSETEKADAQNLVISAFKHWGEVVHWEEDDHNLVISAFKHWGEVVHWEEDDHNLVISAFKHWEEFSAFKHHWEEEDGDELQRMIRPFQDLEEANLECVTCQELVIEY